MTSFATKKYATEDTGFLHTDAEYAEMEKHNVKAKKLYEVLKGMEASGLYGSEKWSEVFTKYATEFKLANGYRPHWAR